MMKYITLSLPAFMCTGTFNHVPVPLTIMLSNTTGQDSSLGLSFPPVFQAQSVYQPIKKDYGHYLDRVWHGLFSNAIYDVPKVSSVLPFHVHVCYYRDQELIKALYENIGSYPSRDDVYVRPVIAKWVAYRTNNPKSPGSNLTNVMWLYLRPWARTLVAQTACYNLNVSAQCWKM